MVAVNHEIRTNEELASARSVANEMHEVRPFCHFADIPEHDGAIAEEKRNDRRKPWTDVSMMQRCSLVLQLHDELLFEVDESQSQALMGMR
jgi:hypothetical protein